MTPEVVWAAIDCPGAYAPATPARGEVVLGRMTARIDRLPEEGERCVVVGWPLGEDGRKLFAGTALYGSPATCSPSRGRSGSPPAVSRAEPVEFQARSRASRARSRAPRSSPCRGGTGARPSTGRPSHRAAKRAQRVGVPEDEDVARAPPARCDDAVDARRDLAAVSPPGVGWVQTVQAGSVSRISAVLIPLVAPVVPLHEVVVDTGVGEPRELGGAARAQSAGS